VSGGICAICCGTEREVSVNCPFDCEYLRDARKHEKIVPVDEAQIPNKDIEVTEKFLVEHEELALALGSILVTAALGTPGVIDLDVREALEALVRTFRSLRSGVYYESVPANPLAGQVFRRVQVALAEFRSGEQQNLGMSRTRDADVLGMLVFLQRLEFGRNNGRRRSRAFLDYIRGFYPSLPEAPPPVSTLILP
jgi:hypothetical protein